MLLIGIGFTAAHAQNADHKAVVCSGGVLTGSGGSASYTVGQMTYTIEGNSETAAQGIQQALEINVNGIDEFKNITLISVFPNPTAALLNLKIEDADPGNLYFILMDITGKQLLRQAIYETNTAVDLKSIKAGNYVLTVYDQVKTIKSFSIIKNN